MLLLQTHTHALRIDSCVFFENEVSYILLNIHTDDMENNLGKQFYFPQEWESWWFKASEITKTLSLHFKHTNLSKLGCQPLWHIHQVNVKLKYLRLPIGKYI